MENYQWLQIEGQSIGICIVCPDCGVNQSTFPSPMHTNFMTWIRLHSERQMWSKSHSRKQAIKCAFLVHESCARIDGAKRDVVGVEATGNDLAFARWRESIFRVHKNAQWVFSEYWIKVVVCHMSY